MCKLETFVVLSNQKQHSSAQFRVNHLTKAYIISAT